jgi:hypothetical protein
MKKLLILLLLVFVFAACNEAEIAEPQTIPPDEQLTIDNGQCTIDEPQNEPETDVGDDEQLTIDNGQCTIDEPQNEPETNVGDDDPVVPQEAPEAPEEIEILEEFPLAGGAVLVIEKIKEDIFERTSFSVVYDDEKIFLFQTASTSYYWVMVEISPDLTKIAYFSKYYDHRGGTLNIFNVLERENFQPFERDYFYQYIFRYDITRYYVPADILWLDDEILLILSTYPHGSSGGGGDIFYHNITDGTTRAIIPYYNHFWFGSLEKDGDNLKLSIARDRGGRNFFRDDMIDMYVPLSQIYEIIENGGTLILDVPPIEEIK